MARTKAPLFGLDASGSLADSVVFSRWKGRTYVRRHAIPANPRSGLQTGLRAVFTLITQDFKTLTTAQKTDWAKLAKADNITPLDAQVRDAQSRARINLGWRQDTTAVDPAVIDPPTALTATPLPKGLRFNWTRPALNQGDYCVALHLYTTAGATIDISNLRVVLRSTRTEVTITGLRSGIALFAKVRETSKSGRLGTLSAEATGTPS